MSHILFSVYVDSLHCRLEHSGVVCHIGGHFVGTLAYADDGKRRQVGQVYMLLSMFVNNLLWYQKSITVFLKVDFLMFLLVAFMLMDNMLQFLSVQCTLVIINHHVIERNM